MKQVELCLVNSPQTKLIGSWHIQLLSNSRTSYTCAYIQSCWDDKFVRLNFLFFNKSSFTYFKEMYIANALYIYLTLTCERDFKICSLCVQDKWSELLKLHITDGNDEIWLAKSTSPIFPKARSGRMHTWLLQNMF